MEKQVNKRYNKIIANKQENIQPVVSELAKT